ncbi:hypothetical protein KSP40_PGU015332 [Platanthera guangdongensis]|uniref:Methyltransferase type 11 domain-containing protein n=1 Tax=Platanthera guangdongensis TaxID=2320717 RepID=A0ABR2MNB0_9ASPA
MLLCVTLPVRSISHLLEFRAFRPLVSVSGYSTRATSESVKFCIMVSSTERMEVSKFTKLNSARKSTPCSTNVRATPDIEKTFVHRVYDAIAPHFSATRFAKWPKVARFLNSLSPGSIILDAGCGNGKYLGLNPNCFYIGCDISPPLMGICAGKGHEVLVADAVNLPYKTNFGDAAISIAVLHHLSTESRRRNAIEELIRVVRKGGLVLITVWAVEQEDSSLLSKWTPLSDKYNEAWVRPSSPRLHSSVALVLEQIPETNEVCSATEISKDQNALPEDGEEDRGNDDMLAASIFNGVQEDAVSSGSGDVETNQEYFVPWHLPYHRAEVSGTLTTEIANGLAKKDDKKGAVVYNRYYHVFVEGELQRLVAGIDNVKTVEQFYDKSNWCVVLQKT